MALETGVTYIEDLVATNPVGATDNIDEGDDHIRNIKTAIQGSFPSLGAAAVTATAAELNIMDGITSFLDEDDMVSNSATSLASQQSIKAYVDTATSRYASVYMTGNQSISISTQTKLAFDAEYADTDTVHDNSTNNSRLTVPTGVTLVTLNYVIEGSTDLATSADIIIYKNGTQVWAGAAACRQQLAPNSSGRSSLSYQSPPIAVVATDYFEVNVFTVDAGGFTVLGGSDKTNFSMTILK